MTNKIEDEQTLLNDDKEDEQTLLNDDKEDEQTLLNYQTTLIKNSYQKLEKYKVQISEQLSTISAINSVERAIQEINKLQNPKLFLEEQKRKKIEEQKRKKELQNRSLIERLLYPEGSQPQEQNKTTGLIHLENLIDQSKLSIEKLQNELIDQYHDYKKYKSPITIEKEYLDKKIHTCSYIISQIEKGITNKNNDIKIIIGSLIIKAKSRETLIINTSKKIGPQELKEEALVCVDVTSKLLDNLLENKITQGNYLIQEPKVREALSIITEIENFKIRIDQILEEDRKRRNKTTIIIICYILFVITFIAFITYQFGDQFVLGEAPLEQSNIPLLGIPWPIIVWSLIGSFAAMISTFNEQPIYDFQDTLKWLLTRPVQGVVLGSAFYLVLTSGLFLLTGTISTDNLGQDNQNLMSERVILVLSFLVSYSDRFGREVFDLLIKRYSNQAKKSKKKKKNKNK